MFQNFIDECINFNKESPFHYEGEHIFVSDDNQLKYIGHKHWQADPICKQKVSTTSSTVNGFSPSETTCQTYSEITETTKHISVYGLNDTSEGQVLQDRKLSKKIHSTKSETFEAKPTEIIIHKRTNKKQKASSLKNCSKFILTHLRFFFKEYVSTLDCEDLRHKLEDGLRVEELKEKTNKNIHQPKKKYQKLFSESSREKLYGLDEDMSRYIRENFTTFSYLNIERIKNNFLSSNATYASEFYKYFIDELSGIKRKIRRKKHRIN